MSIKFTYNVHSFYFSITFEIKYVQLISNFYISN